MNEWDIVIIGGGAAGLSAAQYAGRANLNIAVIEETATGGQALLIDNLENYPGIMGPIDGFTFTQTFEAQAKQFGAKFIYSTVKAIEKESNGTFTLITSKDIIHAKSVIIATGAKHRELGAPGEGEFSGNGVSYCATCDGPFFRNKKIIVVGGGDAACDEANFLSRLTKNLIMLVRKDKLRAQAAVAERVLSNPSIQIRFNTAIKKIMGSTQVESVEIVKTDTNKTYTESVSAVFIFVGSIPRVAFVPKEVKRDENNYLLTDQSMETSIPGIFAAGDVRATPFRQLIVAAGEGAIAAHGAIAYVSEIKS